MNKIAVKIKNKPVGELLWKSIIGKGSIMRLMLIQFL